MSTTTIKVTNDRGRSFNVKLVKEGGTYGLDHCLTHDDSDPLVEFYDATYEGQEGFHAEGQFVARYYASTLQERDRNYGLSLDGGIPEWSVDFVAMGEVHTWLAEALA